MTRIDRFMLGAMAGPTSIAYYEVASRIPECSRNVYNSFQSVYFPNMTELFKKNQSGEIEKVLNVSLRFIAFITTFVTLVVTLFQKEIVTVLFSEKYLSSAPALSLLMVAMTIGLIGNVMGTSLVAFGQSDKPFKVSLFDAVSFVVGNFIMIPTFGFMGAVYAALISRCVANPLNVFFVRKANVKIKVSEYLKPLGAFLLCAMMYWILKADMVILRLFIIFLFLVICSALSVIRGQDIRLLAKELGNFAVRSSKQEIKGYTRSY